MQDQFPRTPLEPNNSEIDQVERMHAGSGRKGWSGPGLQGLQEGDWIVTTVTDSVQPGVKVRTRQSEEAAQATTGTGGAQTGATPDFGPSQYGDQSIVNSAAESTTQKGKPGQSGKSGAQGGSGRGGPGKSDGKQQKQQKDASKESSQ